eukprot:EG_transcript_15570
MGRSLRIPRAVCQLSFRWFSAAATPVTSTPHHRVSSTAPRELMSTEGLGTTLKVKLIRPVWENTEAGRVMCIKRGGLLFDFVPQNVAGSRGLEDWIRFSPTVAECGKILLMDHIVGLQLVHNFIKPSGKEMKTVEWTPATPTNTEMELRVHYSDGTRDKRFCLPFSEAKLVLLQELLESSLPTIAGFGRLAPVGAVHSDDLTFYKKTAGLHIGFAASSPDGTGAGGQFLGTIAKEGRLLFKFAPRDAGRGKHGPAFDWVNAVTFALRADDCAEFTTMSPGMKGKFVRSPSSFRESVKTMTWSLDPDGDGVVAVVSGKGLALQLPLSWAELKVIQVIARSLVPHMLGLSWL